jgi:simple sugar transport system ATP-binding protein
MRGDVQDRPVVLEAIGLRKTYGYITAVEDMNLVVRAGEIIALVGDNGAGKSTVVKMLCGATQPDSGEIHVADGSGRTTLLNPHDARGRGIETVYQDLALAPNRDVVDNLFLGRELCYGGVLGALHIRKEREMRKQAKAQLTSLGINIPSLTEIPIGRMSGGQRQSVAIARAVFWASRVLLMDEPTAALGVRESGAVLELVRRVAKEGVAVVIVSHVLPHVLELADRIVVMRHGRKVAELEDDISQERVISLIVAGIPMEMGGAG